jgi:hypothetical protein
MRPLWYRLNQHHEAVPMEHGPLDPEWSVVWDIANRRVAQTTIGQYRVSTVFLCLDHGFDGEPQLFETMVFGGEDDWADELLWRYSTWEQAERGHQQICALVQVKHEHDTATGRHASGA